MPNQYLVDNVEVAGTKETGIAKDEFKRFFRQRPNRKFFRKIHFFVWWYNLFNEEKIRQKKINRNLRYDRINAERVKKSERKNVVRARKGKKLKTPKLKDKESLIFRESLRDIGEPAVVYDSTLTEQTRFQLSKYLFSKGFFNNEVKDKVELTGKRAKIKYILFPGEPYTVRSIHYRMDDTILGNLLLKDTAHSMIERGMRYDADKFQAERQRMTSLALNNGYYYFENAYVNFDVDSANGDRTVSAAVHLKKFEKHFSISNDSLVLVNHPKMTIENVYIITEPVIGNVREANFKDTIKAEKHGLLFLVNKPLPFRQPIMTNNIDLYKGQLFKKDTAEQTYRQLLGTGIFRNVNVQFMVIRERTDGLDCYIVCTPLIKQSLTGETVGTNTSGNKGIDGSVVYQNRNLFKGGELAELKLMGSLIAQSQFDSEGQDEPTFNTIQFGPELTFSVPRAFFPFSLLPFRKDHAPHTYVKASINYQSRPIYDRVITSFDYGFNFKTHNNTLRHDLIPVEVYFVRAKLSPDFENSLKTSNDAFLINSFQDHVTTLTKYTVTFFSKEPSTNIKRRVHFFRWSVQSSGSLLRKYFELTGGKKDTAGRYLIQGIPFAHFLRTDADYRIYIPIHKKSKLVYRVAAGIGKPLVNLNVLPYEQSFFSGGPNGIRAWRARTLGPGAYDPRTSPARYDKIGDILLEANFEYRFHIINNFHGALFIDAGNIWRLQPDESKPGAEFIANKFIEQIAVGAGFGIRWDLNFFVLRIDLASPMRDPKYASGDRWTFDKKPWNEMVFNFGIGYPF